MTQASAARNAEARQQVKRQIKRGGIVAVMRASTALHFPEIARVLVESGVTTLEVTLTTAGAADSLAEIKANAPDHVLVGAGTVLTKEQAATCIQLGADFLVAPALVPDAVRYAQSTSIPMYPGVMTPSEFVTASGLGADLVKLFPASLLGPAYLRDLRGPFPNLDVMPTGGIKVDQIAAWLSSGAIAVGVGGPLLADAAETGNLTELRQRAEAAVAEVRRANREDDQ